MHVMVQEYGACPLLIIPKEAEAEELDVQSEALNGIH